MSATTLIDGVWDDPAERLEVIAPADGSTCGAVGYGRADTAVAAADAAARAFGEWAQRPARARVTRAFELPSAGSYAEPALLLDVPDGVGLACEEVFGPVAGVFRFATEEEVLTRANDTEMGLAAYVYTRDGGRQWRVGEALETGIVGINHPLPGVAFAPMGGVRQSGLGREGGSLGLEEFEDTRYLSIGV